MDRLPLPRRLLVLPLLAAVLVASAPQGGCAAEVAEPGDATGDKWGRDRGAAHDCGPATLCGNLHLVCNEDETECELVDGRNAAASLIIIGGVALTATQVKLLIWGAVALGYIANADTINEQIAALLSLSASQIAGAWQHARTAQQKCSLEFTRADVRQNDRKLRNYLFRALRAADVTSIASGTGIHAKNPAGSWSVLEHVRLGSRPESAWLDPWISTSRDPLTALGFGSGKGVVAIDARKLSELGIRYVDVFDAIPRGAEAPADLEMIRNQQEVAVYQHVPQPAIVGFLERLGEGRYRTDSVEGGACP